MNFLFIPSHNSIFDIPWALQKMPEHTVNILDSSACDPNIPDSEQNSVLSKH